MKCRGLLIFTLAFVLVLSFAFAQEGNETTNETVEDLPEDVNETEEVVEAEDEEPETVEETIESPDPCGNAVKDAGETCASCPADVRCQSGERCDLETGQCLKESDLMLYIILGFLAVAIVGFLVIRTLRKKKPEEEPKPRPTVQPQQPLPQTGSIQAAAEQKKAVPGEPAPVQPVKPEPNAAAQPASQPVQESTQPPKTEPVQPPKQEEVQMPPGADEPAAPVKGESSIQDFIRMMRSKGHKDEEIRDKLRKKGWPDTKIAVEFLTLKKKK